MGKIINLGNKQEEKNGEKKLVELKGERIVIHVDNGDSFIIARVKNGGLKADTSVWVNNPGEALSLCLCLLEHMQDAFECTKGELLSTLVEYFIDEDCGMEDDEDGN